MTELRSRPPTVHGGPRIGAESHARDAVMSVLPSLTVLEFDPGTEVTARALPDAMVEMTASAGDGLPGLRLEVDLGAAVAYWHPGLRSERILTPDWAGQAETSLVQSAPVGTLLRPVRNISPNGI